MSSDLKNATAILLLQATWHSKKKRETGIFTCPKQLINSYHIRNALCISNNDNKDKLKGYLSIKCPSFCSVRVANTHLTRTCAKIFGSLITSSTIVKQIPS